VAARSRSVSSTNHGVVMGAGVGVPRWATIVADRLRDAILNDQFQPGQRLARG